MKKYIKYSIFKFNYSMCLHPLDKTSLNPIANFGRMYKIQNLLIFVMAP